MTPHQPPRPSERCACGAVADYRCEHVTTVDGVWIFDLLCRACAREALKRGVRYRRMEALPHERRRQNEERKADEAAQLGDVRQGAFGDHHAAPYVRDSATSRAAATWADASGFARTARARVLRALLDASTPMTDEELQARLGMNASTERPRRIELVEDGLVEAAGEGRTRAGRRAVRWRPVRREA